MCFFCFCFVFFFKQKTAYEMRISDWSSDVCSSDLLGREPQTNLLIIGMTSRANARGLLFWLVSKIFPGVGQQLLDLRDVAMVRLDRIRQQVHNDTRSEEHTSELQSLMRISFAVFCLKNKKNTHINTRKQKVT